MIELSIFWFIYLNISMMCLGIFIGLVWQIINGIHNDHYKFESYPKIPKWIKTLNSWIRKSND